MRDFLIKNVSNIYCLLKMDDLEVFGITKSCFEMNYLTVVVVLKFLHFRTEVLDATNNFLTFSFQLGNRFSQSLELRLADVDEPFCVFQTLLVVQVSEADTSPPDLKHEPVLKIK